MTLSLGPIISLIAGILILVMPKLLNFIVAIYLLTKRMLSTTSCEFIRHASARTGSKVVAGRACAFIVSFLLWCSGGREAGPLGARLRIRDVLADAIIVATTAPAAPRLGPLLGAGQTRLFLPLLRSKPVLDGILYLLSE